MTPLNSGWTHCYNQENLNPEIKIFCHGTKKLGNDDEYKSTPVISSICGWLYALGHYSASEYPQSTLLHLQIRV